MMRAFDDAGSDLRHAWRMIRRMPGLAAVVAISLGIAIGVNTAVFSWIQAIALQPLPGVPDSASYYLLEPRAQTGSYPGASWLEYQDLRERLPSFQDLLAFRMAALNVGEAADAERTFSLLVSANYFDALGLRPALGRFLRPAEVAQPGGDPVVVISYEYWQSRFGGARDALGRTIRVNDRLLTVVGVTPPKFQGTVIGLKFDLWMPATLAPALFTGSSELVERNARGYSMLGRLRRGATRAQAQTEIGRAFAQLALAFPESNSKMRGELIPVWQTPRGPQRFMVAALGLLQAILLLLLLAVCGNTLNLLMARAGARRREIAVRLALGAGGWRIVRLLLSENLLLAALGAAVGIPFAAWGTNFLRAVPITAAFPIRFQTGMDGLTLAFAVLLALAAGLAFGIVPAFQLARTSPQGSLHSGYTTVAHSRLRDALMGTQVALAMVVLIAAGLFLRSFQESSEEDPGFRREGVLLAAYDLSGRTSGPGASLEFARRLLPRLHAIPGVEAAAIATQVPLDIHGLPLRSISLEGRTRSEAAPDQALSNVVTPGYFAAMDIPILAGSDFADLTDATTPAQVIVNQEFVRRFIGSGETLGRSVTAGEKRYVIAAIVRNSLYDSFGEPPAPAIYFSYRDRPPSTGEIHLRTSPGNEARLASELRLAVHSIDPGLPIYDVRTLSEHVEKSVVFRRIPARMFSVLGPLLMLLAAIGIYAVVAYSVSGRTTEIGVRLALGASPGRVLRQILFESLGVITVGAAAGWTLGFAAAAEFGRAGAASVAVFAGVPALLLAVATLACLLPARRATRVAPVVALRHE